MLRFIKAVLMLGVFAVALFCVPVVQNAYRVYRYPETFKEFQGYYDSPWMFPDHIPANARHVKIYDYAGWGQGGSFFQLRYELPPAAFQQLVDSVMAQPHTLTVGDPPRFYTGGGDEFPAEYTIYTFTDSGNTNHGFKEGIALNSKNNEAVHWHESW